MNNSNKYLLIFAFLFYLMLLGCENKISDYAESNKKVEIFPDYDSIVLPPNIAPINFFIKEKGEEYRVEIFGDKGGKITICQNSGDIRIPRKEWQDLLKINIGRDFFIQIFIKNGKWVKYKTISNEIAEDSIDSYLVYRKIGNANAYIFWEKMGIYQRNLENFDEYAIYQNTSANENCVNCHSFCKGNPHKMSLHFRLDQGGTMIYNNDKLVRLNTKTKYTMSNFVYPSWHPGGNFIAYSTNLILLNFSATNHIVSELSDKASDIVLYDINRNIVTTSPKISTRSRENLPSWSPDGKWMYFISSPEIDINDITSRILGKYSLLRIPFDAEKIAWGDIDTLLTPAQTGMSVSMPIPSPDNRYILFCLMDHGYFSVFDHESDIYLYDLQTKTYKRLNINSSSNESYHGWSQNGRWIVFSSKRLDNIYSAPHFSYFDRNGQTHKPFVLPQEDPGFYKTYMKNFNRPELITGKVDLNDKDVRDLIYSEAKDVKFDSTVNIDALSGATWIKSHK
jgi:hypothetical protein